MLLQTDQPIGLQYSRQLETYFFSWYCERLQNTTICELIKYEMSRSVFLDSKKLLSGMWYFVIFLSELSWQCGILLFFMDFGTVLTVWYFVIFLLELFWQCGILLFFMDVGTGLTVWYFVVFLLGFGTVLTVVFCCFSWMLELFWQCGILLFF